MDEEAEAQSHSPRFEVSFQVSGACDVTEQRGEFSTFLPTLPFSDQFIPGLGLVSFLSLFHNHPIRMFYELGQ